jgi:hypothetical protein
MVTADRLIDLAEDYGLRVAGLSSRLPAGSTDD